MPFSHRIPQFAVVTYGIQLSSHLWNRKHIRNQGQRREACFTPEINIQPRPPHRRNVVHPLKYRSGSSLLWRPKVQECRLWVNSKGAFTALFRNNQSRTPGSFFIPTGVRYDPRTQAWSSIWTTPDYGWTSDFWAHHSFYVNRDGVESVIHLWTTRPLLYGLDLWMRQTTLFGLRMSESC